MNSSFLATDFLTDALYESMAEKLAAKYEQSNRTAKQFALLETFPQGARLLEIGCGSGSDAAFLLSQRRDVTACDSSTAMLKQAAIYHPELAPYLLSIRLPQPLPFRSGEFYGVIAIAVLMHLPIERQRDALGEIARVLVPGGKLYLATFEHRVDLVNKRDKNGRLFELMPKADLFLTCENAGLHHEKTLSMEDSLGRHGYKLGDYIFTKSRV